MFLGLNFIYTNSYISVNCSRDKESLSETEHICDQNLLPIVL